MNWRNEFMNECSEKVAWLIHNDKRTGVIMILALINAVWFAGLWQSGFTINWSLIYWLIYFVASMAVTIWLELGRNKNG